MQFKEIYQLKVTLLEIEPPIWRRIQVPDSFTLDTLHRVLQIAMGWKNSHLHTFKVKGEEYGIPHPDYDDFGMKMNDEKKITLKQIVDRGVKEFRYEYDSGDSWQHAIKLEKPLEPDGTIQYPICIAGERACPPEDVGGTPGYETFLEAMADKKHPEHQSFKRWVGGSFNPESFDTNSVNRSLRNVRWFPGSKKATKAPNLRTAEQETLRH